MANEFFIQREGEASVDIEASYNMTVTHVEGLHPSDYKPVFMREWANEDGVDIVFPVTRNTKSRDVTLTIYMDGANFLSNYEDFVIFVSGKKFDYWDTVRNKKVSLIFEGSNVPIWTSYTSQQLQFKITFLNYSGTQSDVV